MRILYGVHGYSRGHATRAAAVLSELTKLHDVLILAGPDAYDFLRGDFDVVPIPSLRFIYGADGRISKRATLAHSAPLLADLLVGGRRSAEIRRCVKTFAPQVAISDAEPWTHRVARDLGVPRVGFDHFGIMVHCKVPFAPGDRIKSIADRLAYRLLMGMPQRILVSSFYRLPAASPGAKVIGPLLRPEVHHVSVPRGEHLLVYLNNGAHQLTPRLQAVFESVDVPLRIYGTGREGREGHIEYRPPSGRGFLEDLASSRAVVSTAGNQLVGEALFFGRPLLVMPEDTVEQRMNGAAVARMQVGETLDFAELDGPRLMRFLDRAPAFEANARKLAVDGREAALSLLTRWIDELADTREKAVARLREVVA